MKILLVGQAPSRAEVPPLGGRTGRRMAAIIGITFEQYLDRFDRENLLSSWPGMNGGKGDAFPIAEAKGRAADIAKRLNGRIVLFIGGSVARAFNAGFLRPLEWNTLTYRQADVVKFMAAMFPHPSGVNRWWNEPANVDLARRFAARWLRRGFLGRDTN